jgi:hypothetical protein
MGLVRSALVWGPIVQYDIVVRHDRCLPALAQCDEHPPCAGSHGGGSGLGERPDQVEHLRVQLGAGTGELGEPFDRTGLNDSAVVIEIAP